MHKFQWVVVVEGEHIHKERHWTTRKLARIDKNHLKDVYETDKSITVTLWKITNVSTLFGDTKNVRFMEKVR